MPEAWHFGTKCDCLLHMQNDWFSQIIRLTTFWSPPNPPVQKPLQYWVSCNHTLRIADDLLDTVIVTSDDALKCTFRRDFCCRCCSRVSTTARLSWTRKVCSRAARLCLKVVNKACACISILFSTCCCRSDTPDINGCSVRTMLLNLHVT